MLSLDIVSRDGAGRVVACICFIFPFDSLYGYDIRVASLRSISRRSCSMVRSWEVKRDTVCANRAPRAARLVVVLASKLGDPATQFGAGHIDSFLATSLRQVDASAGLYGNGGAGVGGSSAASMQASITAPQR